MIGRRAIVAALAAGAVLGAAGGCTYEKVVYRRPMLSGLPGAQSGGATISEHPRGYADPAAVEGGKLTIEREDGSKILIARTGKQLMAHIYQTLKDEEKELFTRQVLSEITREEFRANGYDPGEAYEYFKRQQAQIEALFGRMPNGEYSPGVVRRKVGDDVYRVTMSAKAAEGLQWGGFDMVWEGGRLETVGADGGEGPQAPVPTLEEAVAETGSVAAARALIAERKARQPEYRMVQSGWRLRWFVEPGE